MFRRDCTLPFNLRCEADAVNRRTFLEALAACAALPLAGGLRAAGPLLLVGTYTEGKRREGVFAFRMDAETGALTPLGASDVGPDPSFLAVHPRLPVVYAVNEVERSGGEAGGALAAFALDRSTGALAPMGRRATGGGAPCYVSVVPGGRAAMVANYVGGNVAFFPVDDAGALGERARLDQHAGTGPRADRQEKAHAHSVVPDPSGRWALSADLGADRIYVYALGGGAAPAAPAVAARAGAGPRHLTFDRAGRFVYVVNELDLTAVVYRFDAATGGLAAVQSVPLVDAGDAPGSTAADVHLAPSGRFLYASVRGADVLAVFAVDAGTGLLTFVERVPTGGHTPRNFGLDPSGRFLYAANQRSGSVVGFRVDASTGRLTPSGVRVEVPAPVCVRFAE